MSDDLVPHKLDRRGLPDDWPTHVQSSDFWAGLGRTVAAFGMLENTIGRALFVLSGTKAIDPERDVETQVWEWVAQLETNLTDMLGGLISRLENEIRRDDRLAEWRETSLISELREASRIRNGLCHGSWDKPDVEGKSLPKFVDRKLRVWETPVDLAFFDQTQKAVADLTWDVIDLVTLLGYSFPGSNGPGKVIRAAK